MNWAHVLRDLIQVAAELVGEGALRNAMNLLGSYVGELDLANDDSRWPEVQQMLIDSLRDLAAARDLDVSQQERARVVVVQQMHHRMRELGLIDRG